MRWASLAALPANAARDEALGALLEELALRDVVAALDLVAAEPNRLRREKLRAAALRGWGAQAPESAADWVALNLREVERSAALVAVIDGAAREPARARQFVGQLNLADPANAYEHGHALIRAFVARGEFAAAAEFSTVSPAESSARSAWINGAFSSWAQHQPRSAAQAALTVVDPAAREIAFGGVIAGWAPAEPASLAAFSLQMPVGPERTAALAEALRHWVTQEATAASNWMSRLEPSAELDAGAAAVATFLPLIASRPEVALGWAQAIVEPALREQTLAVVQRARSLADSTHVQRTPAGYSRPEVAAQK